MLQGILNCLNFINENMATILAIICVGYAIYKKCSDFNKLTDEQKVEIAKKKIAEVILKLVTEAEKDYADWDKAGSIKRSQVISEIFKDNPILLTVVNQEEIIKFIDESIDDALYELRKIIREQETTEKAN